MTVSTQPSAFTGFRFPRDVVAVAVRWYLRYGLSYRAVEELLAERGIRVDHVTVYRWVQRFTPEFIDAARPCRRLPGDRWFIDETYVKISGCWTYLYRAIDQHGQVIDVTLSKRRDLAAASAFFRRALALGITPTEITTDRAPAYPRALDEYVPAALHTVEQYANNPIEADHSRLKAWLRPMRGLNASGRRKPSRPDTPSCRTCDAALRDCHRRISPRPAPRRLQRNRDPRLKRVATRRTLPAIGQRNTAHLAALERAGLVDSTPQGRQMTYRIRADELDRYANGVKAGASTQRGTTLDHLLLYSC
jgi:IS6 family transposase